MAQIEKISYYGDTGRDFEAASKYRLIPNSQPTEMSHWVVMLKPHQAALGHGPNVGSTANIPFTFAKRNRTQTVNQLQGEMLTFFFTICLSKVRSEVKSKADADR